MGARENGEERDDCSSDMEVEVRQAKDAELDYEQASDSLSLHGEVRSNGESKNRRSSRVQSKVVKKELRETVSRASRSSGNRQVHSQLQHKSSINSPNKSLRPYNKTVSSAKTTDARKSEVVRAPSLSSSEISEEADDKAAEELKEIDVLDEAQICDIQRVVTDDDAAGVDVHTGGEEPSRASEKLEMEQRIERLEQELREVAALEISVYSVVPEHTSSSHKVHMPARCLLRFYVHACDHWSSEKRASVAKNVVSGLLLIAKSCSNDVSRLTYWLSNTIVLREMLDQTVGSTNKANSKQCTDEWQENGTFLAALEKTEAWMFSRLVELVWWQALTPHMQAPKGSSTPRTPARPLGQSLGDRKQGDFSISLWKGAFQEAFNRLCPLRAGGHECGCLPVLARMVMEQCISRLDVAMFNAILRESEHEMPTDPISDPINCPRVLPIPAGELTFGSGAMLKNSIGNWSRWLTDKFGMDDDTENEGDADVCDHRRRNSESKSFRLLNELSDLLMLPKDMLLERSIREEVCPSIDLALVTRILCNFTPDEFCPDPVPGMVLEELNSERVLEQPGTGSFPHNAAPVVYRRPSLSDVAEKVSELQGRGELSRRGSVIQSRGYISNDDLDYLDSPFSSLTGTNHEEDSHSDELRSLGMPLPRMTNARYELIQEVWSGRS